MAGFAVWLLAALLAPASRLEAQQSPDAERQLGWFLSAELSFVMTSGNAVTTTLGAGASARRVWERTRWQLAVGGLRTRAADVTRRAIGSADDFVLVKESESQLTAENYHARTRVDRSLSERSFLYGGVSWTRNIFTGIDARWSLVGGGGLTAWEGDRGHLRLDAGATYTVENPTVEGSPNRNFAGIRLSWDYARKLTGGAEFTSLLILDENLDDADDLRGDLTSAISVSLSKALALRTSLQLLYDAQPALEQVPLVTPGGEPTGESVLAELNRLDSQLTVAIVLTF